MMHETLLIFLLFFLAFCATVCGTHVHNRANPTQCAIECENGKNGTILKFDIIEVTRRIIVIINLY